MLELLAPLDYPRQALANLTRGLGRAFEGEASADDYIGMLPAALGVGAGLAGLGPLGMALSAGLGQGMGRLTGMQAFDAPTVQDTVSAIGGDPDSLLQNLGVQMATDPLTLAGAAPLFPGQRALTLAEQLTQTGKARPVINSIEQLREAARSGQMSREALAQMAQEAAAATPIDEALAGMGLPPRSGGVTFRGKPLDQAALDALPQRPVEPVPDIGHASMYLEPYAALPPTRRPILEQRPAGLPPLGSPPEAYQDELSRLLGMAGDLEQDFRDPGFLRSVGATGALAQRANLWESILAGMGEYKGITGGLPSLGQEAANVIGQSYGRNLGEPALLEMLRGAPTSPELVALAQQMAPMRHGGGLAYLGDRARSFPSLSSLHSDMSIHGAFPPKELMDEVWGLLDKQTFRLNAGSGTPAEAAAMIDELQAMGWPIDRALASKAYWRGKLNNMHDQTRYLPQQVRNVASDPYWSEALAGYATPQSAIPGAPPWAGVTSKMISPNFTENYGLAALASRVGDPFQDVYSVFGEPGVQAIMRRATQGVPAPGGGFAPYDPLTTIGGPSHGQDLIQELLGILGKLPVL